MHAAERCKPVFICVGNTYQNISVKIHQQTKSQLDIKQRAGQECQWGFGEGCKLKTEPYFEKYRYMQLFWNIQVQMKLNGLQMSSKTQTDKLDQIEVDGDHTHLTHMTVFLISEHGRERWIEQTRMGGNSGQRVSQVPWTTARPKRWPCVPIQPTVSLESKWLN